MTGPASTTTSTTSGVAVLAPAPAAHPSWSVTAAPRRRWPVLLLLTAALLSTALLALLAPGTF